MRKGEKGLVVARGSSKHDRLVASTIKFLVNVSDASILDIYTDKKIIHNGKEFFVDINWKNNYIECVASDDSIGSSDKIDALLSLKEKIVLSVAESAKIKHISGRLLPKIKGILIFNQDTEKLVKSLNNFDEYLGYLMLKEQKPVEAVIEV